MYLINNYPLIILVMFIYVVMEESRPVDAMNTVAVEDNRSSSLIQRNAGHSLLFNKRSSNKNKNKNKKKSKSKSKKYSKDCKNRVCPLTLKACPKDCPMSCGYLNSPDPCCPLLGKPTCPDY